MLATERFGERRKSPSSVVSSLYAHQAPGDGSEPLLITVAMPKLNRSQNKTKRSEYGQGVWGRGTDRGGRKHELECTLYMNENVKE